MRKEIGGRRVKEERKNEGGNRKEGGRRVIEGM